VADGRLPHRITTAQSFTDVVASWQQDPVSWMAATGITTGTSATTYTPEGLVTRGEVAALLHRLAGSPDAPPSQFTDVTTAWQVTPVGWMVQQGITTGTTPTMFSPDKTVRRWPLGDQHSGRSDDRPAGQLGAPMRVHHWARQQA
jgi:hypothetical protein